MTRIYVLHENDEWTQPLYRELEALAIPFEGWFLDRGSVDLRKSPPDGIFYNRMSASSHTRGHRFAPEYTGVVLSWLETHCRRVLNTSRALQLEMSKVEQYAALAEFDIPTPATLAAVGRLELIEAGRRFQRPFITKHNRGGKGLGVRLFSDVEALERHVEGPNFEESVDGITLVQQYVRSPEPFITRCEFVGGELIYAVRADTSDGFELCPADACEAEERFCPATGDSSHRFEVLKDFWHPLVPRFARFLERNGIHIAGIEFITDHEGRAFVYDVNTNTNYNFDAESRAGIPGRGMKSIADYLGTELEKVRSLSGWRVASPATTGPER